MKFIIMAAVIQKNLNLVKTIVVAVNLNQKNLLKKIE